jgi:3-oxoacyl-[acyl-carrier-protein] synthase II
VSRLRRVVVTGIGVVSPFGVGVQPFWSSLAGGKSAASLIRTFDVSSLPTRFAAQLSLTDGELEALLLNPKSAKTLSRAGKFTVIAAEEAARDARLESAHINPYRLGTSIGAGGLGLIDLEHTLRTADLISDCIGEDGKRNIEFARLWKNSLEQVHPLTPLRGLSNIPTAHVAINNNARGICQTITTACTSSAQAIGEAFNQIRFGTADVMIAGGSDSMVNPNGLIAFSALGVLSKNNGEFQTAARPFDRRRDGFMLGEGGAIVVVEELSHCRARGAEPYAEIVGYASTCDAFRLTDEPPEAWGSVEAMNMALDSAHVAPEEVHYINAHGTGTRMNDKTETFAIKTAFGRAANAIPVSSTKSMIGHLVAGAGAVEFAACLLSMEHGCILPTINYEEPDSDCDLDCVPNHAREGTPDVILSNSFGFGGQNACLVLRRIGE